VQKKTARGAALEKKKAADGQPCEKKEERPPAGGLVKEM